MPQKKKKTPPNSYDYLASSSFDFQGAADASRAQKSARGGDGPPRYNAFGKASSKRAEKSGPTSNPTSLSQTSSDATLRDKNYSKYETDTELTALPGRVAKAVADTQMRRALNKSKDSATYHHKAPITVATHQK